MLASAHNAMVIETYTMSEFFLTFPMLLLHSILKTVVWLALIQLFGSIHTEILSNCYNINCVRDCCCHILRATHMQSVPFGRWTIIILWNTHQNSMEHFRWAIDDGRRAWGTGNYDKYYPSDDNFKSLMQKDYTTLWLLVVRPKVIHTCKLIHSKCMAYHQTNRHF